MCGIAGAFSVGRARTDELREVAERMSASVAHRGPDDAGLWTEPSGSLVLAHRRLAIVDLTPDGHQPMTSHDGRWTLVFNGEIYDHAEHRRRLESEGVRFRGRSDTEVLLELIARRGLQPALRAVDGMFALAAWDSASRRLLLARDRVGEKPLHYCLSNGVFAFASELRALRSVPGMGGLDQRAVAEFLRLGFVPAPLSALAGAAKLPAGTLLEVGLDDAPGEPEAWWDLHRVASRSEVLDGQSDAELVRQADDMLRTSVQRRLTADVPVGAFLSGGIDSSLVTAVAQAVSARPVRTFSVAVGGLDDESGHAAAVAAHLGTEHTTLQLAELDPLDAVQRTIDIFDEPFADPSGVPTALLCAAAREHVTVALSGDGGDEIFAGYNRYRIASGSLGKALRIPRQVRLPAARLLGAPSPASWDRWSARLGARSLPALGDKVGKLSQVLGAHDVHEAYGALVRQWGPQDLAQPVDQPHRPAAGRLGPLDQLLLADQEVTLPDDMLVKVDRASMAVALEVRVPLLSPELVEWSWQLPQRAKVRDGRGKWILRRLLEDYVPPELTDRPKLGFDPPLAGWLRGPLRAWAHDVLSETAVRRHGFLRPDSVQRVLGEHMSGARNHDYKLWAALMLHSWADRLEDSLVGQR